MDWEWSACPRLAAGAEINEVADGYIVYQADRDRVHYLNHTAVLVLELCNGRIRADEMPDLLRQAYDLPARPTDEVAACLTQLFAEGLVR